MDFAYKMLGAPQRYKTSENHSNSDRDNLEVFFYS